MLLLFIFNQPLPVEYNRLTELFEASNLNVPIKWFVDIVTTPPDWYIVWIVYGVVILDGGICNIKFILLPDELSINITL